MALIRRYDSLPSVIQSMSTPILPGFLNTTASCASKTRCGLATGQARAPAGLLDLCYHAPQKTADLVTRNRPLEADSGLAV